MDRLSRIERIVEENSKQIDRLGREIGRITRSFGLFAEGLALSSCVEYFRERFEVRKVMERVKAERDGMNAEYDLVIVGDEVVVLISIKSQVSSRDVEELLRDMDEFFYFMEEFHGKTLWGGIAGITWGKGAEEYALKKGLFVFKPSGNILIGKEPKKIREKKG